jgi:hypothetical protein
MENLVVHMDWLTAQIADMAVLVVNQTAAMEAQMVAMAAMDNRLTAAMEAKTVAMAAMDNQLTAALWKPKWLPWPPWTTG